MEVNKIMLLIIKFLLLVSVVGNVQAFDDVLQQESIVYGISVTNSSKTNAKCSPELQIFAAAVDNKEDWAIKMLDASGTARTQFTWGQNFWIGSRLQCEALIPGVGFHVSDKLLPKHSAWSESPPPFDVQYYMAYFRHNSKLQFVTHFPDEDVIQLGLCLPKTCDAEDISDLLQIYFDTRTLLAQRLFDANFTMMEVKKLPGDNSLMRQPKFIIMSIILLSTLICLTIGTIYDVYYCQPKVKDNKEIDNQNNEKTIVSNSNALPTKTACEKNKPTFLGQALLCFSIRTNTKIMFSTEISSDSVASIHGMRFLGMMWILMVHTLFYVEEVADNKLYQFVEGDKAGTQIFTNASHAVDSFLFISGFLVSYLFYLNWKKNFKMSPVQHIQEYFLMVIKRYLRLTPAYMVVLGLTDMTATFVRQNSQYYMTERNNENCGKYWWRNILYINNLYPRDEMCMSWSWYLSNDMQFFVLSVALLKISTICFALSAGILVSLIVGCSALSAYIAYSYDYIPTLDEQLHLLEVLYDPPWTRIGPYLIGTACGYILHKLKGKLILKKPTLIICWILGASLNIVILFGLVNKDISILTSAVHVGLSRLGWGVGIAWVIMACATGNGGVVNSILGWRYFIPWSRLTYCVYLINPVIISSMFFMTAIPAHVEVMSSIVRYGGYSILIFFVAYILSLGFETPNILLTKLMLDLLGSGKKSSKKKTDITNKQAVQGQQTTAVGEHQNGRSMV